jgi:hypothetical protein
MHPRNTLYAVAWGMLELPKYEPYPVAHAYIARQRLQIKKACQAYAMARGFRLSLLQTDRSRETWWVYNESLAYGNQTLATGSLQDCCKYIVTHDMQYSSIEEDCPIDIAD